MPLHARSSVTDVPAYRYVCPQVDTLRSAITFGETTTADGTIQEQEVAGEMGMGRKLLQQYEAQFSVQLKLAAALAMRQEEKLQEALEAADEMKLQVSE